MGLNWSEGLKGLSGGLGMYLQYQSQLDERKYQERRDAANQQFQESLLAKQGEQQMRYLGETQKHSAQEAAKEREARAAEFTAQAAQWDKTYQLQERQLEATLSQNDLARSDIKLQRELALMSEERAQVAAQISSGVKAMNDELGQLHKTAMEKMMPPEQIAEQQTAIIERYNQQLSPLQQQYETSLNSQFERLGVERPEREVPKVEEPKPKKTPPPVSATIEEIRRAIKADSSQFTDMGLLKIKLKEQGYSEADIKTIIDSVPRGLSRIADSFMD